MDPIDPKLRDDMNLVGRMLSAVFKPFGFTLLVFDVNRHDGRMNYISNANRADMLVAMKEFIAKHEGRAPEEIGHG